MAVCVKICGVRTAADARAAAEAGADMIGVNFHPPSKRFATDEQAHAVVAATPPGVELVGVFVDRTAADIRQTLAATGIGTVQLHGEEPDELLAELAPLRVIRAVGWSDLAGLQRRVDAWVASEHPPIAVLVDSRGGGTGRSWDWPAVAGWRYPLPLLVAGGLTPGNVADAIRVLQPYGVDVAGGVESAPGVKDAGRMRTFVQAAHAAAATDPTTSHEIPTAPSG